MKTKFNIIAFGETATIVANSIEELPLNTTRVCVYDPEAPEEPVTAENIEAMVKFLLTDRTPHCTYLLVISMADRQSTEYAIAFAKHNETLSEGKLSQVLILEVDMRDALDEERGAEKIRDNLAKLQKKVNPRSSHDKRRQKNGYFGLGFFTPGTVFEYSVNGYVPKDEEPIRLTASHVVCNEPGSFIIVSTEDDVPCIGGKKSVNIDHVKRIIKQVPGRVQWDREREARRLVEFFKDEQRFHYNEIVKKHPSRYRVSCIRSLIYTLVEDMIVPDTQLDGNKLVTEISTLNLFKTHVVIPADEFGRWGYNLYSVNKKVLKKAIKRLLNKCLVNVHKASEEHNEMMNEIYEDDWKRQERQDDEDNNLSRPVASHYDPDEDRTSSFYSFGDDVDVGDQVREGLEDVLSPSEQRMEDSHNQMMDEEAEMERQGFGSRAELANELDLDIDHEPHPILTGAPMSVSPVIEFNVHYTTPSLGDLLREKIARDVGEAQCGIAINISPMAHPVVTEEGLLTPHTADVEQMLDAEGENEFFEVKENDFGYPQRYQWVHGKMYPVCACCNAAVMPNRGQGSACDTCQAEAMDEAAHDYTDHRVAPIDMLARVADDITDTEFEQMKSDNEKGRERISNSDEPEIRGYATDAQGKQHDLRDMKTGVDLLGSLLSKSTIWNEPRPEHVFDPLLTPKDADALPPGLEAALEEEDKRERDFNEDGSPTDPLSIAGIGAGLKKPKGE